jgi:hypothetical protein
MPTLAEEGRIWVCDQCGDLTHDPTLEAQRSGLMDRLRVYVEQAITASLSDHAPDTQRLIDTNEVMEITGLSYHAVRTRRDELGCVSRPNAPMKFPLAAVKRWMRGESQPAQANGTEPPPRPEPSVVPEVGQVELLPVKGTTP